LKKVIAIDKTLNNIAKRLSVFDHYYDDGDGGNGDGRGDDNNTDRKTQEELDDIETEQYGEPRRFHIYRAARAEITKPAVGLTYEDVYDSITQEELDWSLRQQLKVSPEERYQDMKKHWYAHELSYWHQKTICNDTGNKKAVVDTIKEYGCGKFTEKNIEGGWCVPECRYYSQTGRIEDSEVIQKHRELEKRYRDNNAIVEPCNTNTTSTYR
jgi:hypothetical protein